MSDLEKELSEIADRLERLYETSVSNPAIQGPMHAIEQGVTIIGRAWSGSWVGDLSRVYYRNFMTPPLGERFDMKAGLPKLLDGRGVEVSVPNKNWRLYEARDVEEKIVEITLGASLEYALVAAARANEVFEEGRAEALSILAVVLEARDDLFLAEIRDAVAKTAIVSIEERVRRRAPWKKEELQAADLRSVKEGIQMPPHVGKLLDLDGIDAAFEACRVLGRILKRGGSHLRRVNSSGKKAAKAIDGARVFVGHGHSPAWLELKIFISERLGLPVEEFNRVPAAGASNKERLSEMLDASAMAFLILTGEDEQAGGRVHARQNVVHEVGLFQGRYGFNRAIILLEEGCESFSNLDGLVYIPFPKDRISAAFEEIRRVVEREGLVLPLGITGSNRP